MTHAKAHRTPVRHQRGVALFVVLVFVMLSMLLALWASRTSLFNELVVGNDADYQRAFEAAQALMQDAELDIRGENADGSVCTIDGSKGDVCRRTTLDKIPLEAKDLGELLAELENPATAPTHCRNGLCAKRLGRQDFWNTTASTTLNTGESSLPQMVGKDADGKDVGARYGQYTGAAIGASTSANPILADQSAVNQGGWYWIEVLPYDESSKTSALIIDPAGTKPDLLPLNLTPSVVYRITALAYGRKANSMVVLQETYAPQRLKD